MSKEHGDLTSVAALWEALAHQAGRNGLSVARAPMVAPTRGYTDFRTREIVVADRLDELNAVARLAHEVGHVRLHSTSAVTAVLRCDGMRQIEAEIFAFLVLSHYRLGTADAPFDYIARWAAHTAPVESRTQIDEICARVAQAAARTVELMGQHHAGRRAQSQRDAAAPEPEASSPDLGW
ncbi:hypothetical protein GCM10009745_72280 [Kribbella yunnanensis]|uniref:IrrE N-terminal-like domain-containing protein n=1 Tax=Kribbella yunnanensis TaxID=190194 RepID=A0ABN2IX28_9ACTN